jgi:hypothetical protein
MQNCVRTCLEMSTDYRGIFHVALFRHNVAARCQPRPAAWETARRNAMSPNWGGPNRSWVILAAWVPFMLFTTIDRIRLHSSLGPPCRGCDD